MRRLLDALLNIDEPCCKEAVTKIVNPLDVRDKPKSPQPLNKGKPKGNGDAFRAILKQIEEK